MTRLRRLALSLAVSNALLPATPAAAATFTVLKGGAIGMQGEIKQGDADRLTAAIVRASNKGWNTNAMWMYSPGGDVDAGRELAELVNGLGIQVGVGPGDYCNSACVLVFAAGNKRVVYSTSRMAVHSVGETDEANSKGPLVETEGARATTVLLARRMADYGTPPSVVTKLITTSPSSAAPLTLSDYRAWGVEVRP